MCVNRVRVLVAGHIWKTRFATDSEHVGEIGHNMEQSLRQKTGTMDNSHRSSKKPLTVSWETTLRIANWGYSRTRHFARDFWDAKSTSGWVLCVFGKQAFVPFSWLRKKQSVVAHSSAESKVISLETKFKNGIPMKITTIAGLPVGNFSHHMRNA